MRIYDISSEISNENLFPGQSRADIYYKKNISTGDKCNISDINNLNSHSGTHVDFPFHMIDNGLKSEDYDVNNFVLNAQVINIQGKINIIEQLKGIEIENKIVILKTKEKNSGFNSDYFYLDLDIINYLLDRNIKAFGIDEPSVDGYGRKEFLNHKTFFKKNILIFEGLNLDNINEGEYLFIGLPLKMKGLEASPIRAILIDK